MKIKTCEQYVLDQLEQAREERDWLRGKLEQAQDEAEELLKIADMRKRNPSDSAERRFFMLVEQALGVHQ